MGRETMKEAMVRLHAESPLVRALLAPAMAARSRWLGARRARASGLLDALVARLAEDPLLRIDEFEGVFSLDRRSDLFRRVILEGGYEPRLVRQFLAHVDRERDVLDVGANVGFFSVLAAKTISARRVVAVEPTPNALSRLRRNLALNGVDPKVLVFEGVLAAAPGSLEIHYVEGMEEYSSLGQIAHPAVEGSAVRSKTVEATTVDELVSRTGIDPGFIKIDVEGMEHVVLAGATAVLERRRPVVMTELSDVLLRKNGSSAAEVVGRMRRLGYRVVDPLWPSVAPGLRDFGDMLCIPE
jgi:FkbM family methyltransferase